MVLSFLGVCKTTTKLRINIILLRVCKITIEILQNTQFPYLCVLDHLEVSHMQVRLCVCTKNIFSNSRDTQIFSLCVQEIPSLKHTLNTNPNHHLTYFNHHLNLLRTRSQNNYNCAQALAWLNKIIGRFSRERE